mmetsp:Transcript_84466/g.219906  ORF Transcript_84466/g.219906 Transcript_84466/m.219906 type:complete len:325 (-) Transcript_84466:21-995(-)
MRVVHSFVAQRNLDIVVREPNARRGREQAHAIARVHPAPSLGDKLQGIATKHQHDVLLQSCFDEAAEAPPQCLIGLGALPQHGAVSVGDEQAVEGVEPEGRVQLRCAHHAFGLPCVLSVHVQDTHGMHGAETICRRNSQNNRGKPPLISGLGLPAASLPPPHLPGTEQKCTPSASQPQQQPRRGAFSRRERLTEFLALGAGALVPCATGLETKDVVVLGTPGLHTGIAKGEQPTRSPTRGGQVSFSHQQDAESYEVHHHGARGQSSHAAPHKDERGLGCEEDPKLREADVRQHRSERCHRSGHNHQCDPEGDTMHSSAEATATC